MLSIGSSRSGVNFYPVTAYLGPGPPSLPVKNYQIRLLLRHVAINTVTRDLVVQLWEHSGVRFVATQTTLREGCGIMLPDVDVMTSQTRHRR